MSDKLAMPTFEIICLANSLKHGGRCIAGFKTDGSGWFRPVSAKADGTLYEEHYALANGRKPQLFSIIEIECDRRHSRPHQPENWQISDRSWQFVGWPTTQQLNQLLKAEIQKAHRLSGLLGNQSDRLEFDRLRENPPEASLCLVKPKKIRWLISTRSQKRKFRAIFNLNGIQYNLGITDPAWRTQLERLEDGQYNCQQVITTLNLSSFDPDKFLLTISLSEPFQPTEDEPFYCFKLVAAVINTTDVKTFLQQVQNTRDVDSQILALNRDLELSSNKILFSVKPLIDRAVKTCWESYPEEKRSLGYLRQNLNALLKQTLDDFEQNLMHSYPEINSSNSPIEEIRKQYPRAYMKWTAEDDEELGFLFAEGMSIKDLAQHFQRKPGAIRSRLQKLDLVE